MRYIYLLLFILICSHFSRAQTLSNETIISLITCDEGEEIYSLFGHSAIRVQDVRNNIDLVYNWGMFEFGNDELDFQIKFAKGKLKYYMAEELYESFIYGYQLEKRTVREQVINLSYEQKMNLLKEIQINYLPENRYYNYDFFFDNCSTRIGLLIKKVLDNTVTFKELPQANKYTYRQLIDKQVNSSQPWSDFGIDLALGSKIDKITTSQEMQFLPKYLEESLNLASLNEKGKNDPLVLTTNILVHGEDRSSQKFEGITPSFITWTIFILGLIIHLFNIRKIALVFDTLFLLTITILGVLVFLLWFYTDHQPTKTNYNLLWANPLSLITIITLFLKPSWVKKYHLILAFYSFAIILFWIALPQEFNHAVKPLILLQVLISYYWYRNFSILPSSKASIE